MQFWKELLCIILKEAAIFTLFSAMILHTWKCSLCVSLSNFVLSLQRRIDEDTLDETVTEFKKQGAVASDKRDVEKAETLKEYIIPSDDSNHRVEDGSKEKKQGGEKVRNRYGIKDTEVESITDDEDVSIWRILLYFK